MEFGPDVINLAKKLVLGYREYFSYDKLNSEGRKVFEEMARMLIDEHPELKPLVRRVRRKPTFDNVSKILRLVLGDEVNYLLEVAIQGPYTLSDLMKRFKSI